MLTGRRTCCTCCSTAKAGRWPSRPTSTPSRRGLLIGWPDWPREVVVDGGLGPARRCRPCSARPQPSDARRSSWSPRSSGPQDLVGRARPSSGGLPVRGRCPQAAVALVLPSMQQVCGRRSQERGRQPAGWVLAGRRTRRLRHRGAGRRASRGPGAHVVDREGLAEACQSEQGGRRSSWAARTDEDGSPLAQARETGR